MPGDRLDVEVHEAVAVVVKPVFGDAHARVAGNLIHQRHPIGVADPVLHKLEDGSAAALLRLLNGVDGALLQEVDPIADQVDRVPGLEVERLLAEGAEGVVENGDGGDGGVDGAILGQRLDHRVGEAELGDAGNDGLLGEGAERGGRGAVGT